MVLLLIVLPLPLMGPEKRGPGLHRRQFPPRAAAGGLGIQIINRGPFEGQQEGRVGGNDQLAAVKPGESSKNLASACW